MAAYLVVDIANIHDAATYADYRAQVSPGLEAAGGMYLARGGATEILEGEWAPDRLVIVRFQSMETARRWWKSPSYAALKRMRQRSTRTNMVLVEGIADDPRAGP
ncbi:MAG: DUF1330 domain-containing protein [Bryobacteraceae bacterium]